MGAEAMRREAAAMYIQGVAVALVWTMQTTVEWDPTIRLVGRFYRGPKPENGPEDIGTNYATVAPAKLFQMLRTGKPSGQTPIKGENSYRGGDLVDLGEGNMLFAAFSGGTEDQDLQIARAGLVVMKKLWEQPAASSLEHVCINVRGNLDWAVELFELFGWESWPNRKVSWESGEAVFVYNPEGGTYIQLTFEADQQQGSPGSAQHIALLGDVEASLGILRFFATKYSMDFAVEDVGGGKMMVTLPALFYGSIELVPNQHPDFASLILTGNVKPLF